MNAKKPRIVTIGAFKGGVGKTTSAVHLASALALNGRTLLIDGDRTSSATHWANRGSLPFPVMRERQALRHVAEYDWLVIDTEAGPQEEDFKTLVQDSDLLIVPTTADALGLDALTQTLRTLADLGAENFRVLLTLMPPPPRKDEGEARKALEGLPVFRTAISRLVAFEKAGLEGKSVQEINDRNAPRAWSSYLAVAEEVKEVLNGK